MAQGQRESSAAAGSLRLAMVAAEASGDLLASSILRGLRGATRTLEAFGVGGPAMRAQQFNCWDDIDQLSVRGYVEVLSALPRLLALRRSLGKRVAASRPDAFIGIDAPDFNLGLEKRLRAQGVRTIHFVSPSIWAWRSERIASIRESVDHMLLVFPFEQRLYDQAGIRATYVGHPLADVLAPGADLVAARQALQLPLDKPVIALLPGSRPDEIRYMGRSFIETAQWMFEQRRDCHFVLPAASPALFERLRRMAESVGRSGQAPITIVSGQSHRAMVAADTVLVASGTATLEAALIGRPMVIAYRMAELSYRLMKNRGLLPWIGLPNILCEASLVPEFIQHQATPEALGRALLAQLDDTRLQQSLRQRFAELHATLRRNCSERSAEAILSDCATSARPQ